MLNDSMQKIFSSTSSAQTSKSEMEFPEKVATDLDRWGSPTGFTTFQSSANKVRASVICFVWLVVITFLEMKERCETQRLAHYKPSQASRSMSMKLWIVAIDF